MSTPATAPRHPDRAAAVRAALRRVVAERGFHGASMSAVAAEAGVATGTAYVHYRSKDELVLAAYVEAKDRLGRAATAAVDPGAGPEKRFRSLWEGAYRHLAAHPEDARFLIQLAASPYSKVAHEVALARTDDPLMRSAEAPDMAARLVPLPPQVLYELSIAPAVRLAAAEIELDDDQVELVAGACWQAVTRD